MISLAHFAGAGSEFAERAGAALDALAARPGYLRGRLGRAIDDPHQWILVTEWANVGSYRRALGNYDVKVRAAPLLGEAIDLPSGFESLLDVAPGGAAAAQDSDRAFGAGEPG